MKLRVNDKNLARKLRRKGYSYREIAQQIGSISKGTLSNWLKDIVLTPQQSDRLVEKMRKFGLHGRQLGANSNRLARQERVNKAHELAIRQYPELKLNPIFGLGLVLYVAEGAKTNEHFQFMNSDPQVIQLMLHWLFVVCRVSLDKITLRIYTHKIYKDLECERFWKKVTGLPSQQFRKTVYKSTIHTQKKNEKYMGCCRIDVSGVQFYRILEKWQRLFFEDIGFRRSW
ncbi:MAG: hypothetical protein AAB647_02865 [Patescibacteria group bacterium]